MAIFGWVYKKTSKFFSRIEKIENEHSAMRERLSEDYIKKIEVQQMMAEIKQTIAQNQMAFTDAVNHLREDIRAAFKRSI
jgi:hypothetical protein